MSIYDIYSMNEDDNKRQINRGLYITLESDTDIIRYWQLHDSSNNQVIANIFVTCYDGLDIAMFDCKHEDMRNKYLIGLLIYTTCIGLDIKGVKQI